MAVVLVFHEDWTLPLNNAKIHHLLGFDAT
jgi:hypothetical protein